MHIERNYYTEAMQQAELTDEAEAEQIRELLYKLEGYLESCPITPNAQKIEWFEGLSGCVLEFAEFCQLNVVMRIAEDFTGIIEFETSFFELMQLDPSNIRSFWVYLFQLAGRFNITLCEEVFRIQFFFPLFDSI